MTLPFQKEPVQSRFIFNYLPSAEKPSQNNQQTYFHPINDQLAHHVNQFSSNRDGSPERVYVNQQAYSPKLISSGYIIGQPIAFANTSILPNNFEPFRPSSNIINPNLRPFGQINKPNIVHKSTFIENNTILHNHRLVPSPKQFAVHLPIQVSPKKNFIPNHIEQNSDLKSNQYRQRTPVNENIVNVSNSKQQNKLTQKNQSLQKQNYELKRVISHLLEHIETTKTNTLNEISLLMNRFKLEERSNNLILPESSNRKNNEKNRPIHQNHPTDHSHRRRVQSYMPK